MSDISNYLALLLHDIAEEYDYQNDLETKDPIKILQSYNINKSEVKSLIKDILKEEMNKKSVYIVKKLIDGFKDSFSQYEYENFMAAYLKRQNAEDFYSIMKCESSFSECNKLKDKVLDFYYSAPKEVKQIVNIATKSYLNDHNYGVKIRFDPESGWGGAYYKEGKDIHVHTR